MPRPPGQSGQMSRCNDVTGKRVDEPGDRSRVKNLPSRDQRRKPRDAMSLPRVKLIVCTHKRRIRQIAHVAVFLYLHVGMMNSTSEVSHAKDEVARHFELLRGFVRI